MFTKNFVGGGRGNFHGGKLTLKKNVSQENCPPEICPRSPREKEKKKKKKIDSRKYYPLGKM